MGINWGNYAEAYKAIHDKLDEILTKLDYPTDPAVQDVIDRADRLLGKVYGSAGQPLAQTGTSPHLLLTLPYGSQGQYLRQRASTYDLLVQLRHQGTEIDPRNIRNLQYSVDTILCYGDVGQLLQRSTRDLLVQLRHAGTEIDPRNIQNLPKKGTPTRINLTASGEIVAAPAANNHLELRGFVISVDADEIVRLRWGGATGPIIAMLPTKGILAMNLVNIDEKGAGGASPQNLYLEKTGVGNCQGTVWTETVAD